MHAVNQTQEKYPWWAGNARFIHLSNTFIVAHVAQAALIMLWAGAFTLFELAVYSPKAPMYDQGLILLPHLATQGWGVGAGGAIADTFPLFAIGVIHLVAAGVLAGGAFFHRDRLPQSLTNARGNATKFDFDWADSKQLGFILGHHLAILGLGALLLVIKAKAFGGLYDANIGEVRVVNDPTLDFGTLLSYRTHLFDVNNLEDLVGGHIYVAVLLLLGGAWHILVPPFKWVQQRFLFSADGILAYSLFGIAIAGFAASYYCGFNTLAYPTEFYGPPLELKSAFLPTYFDPTKAADAGYSSRTWLANTHFYLAFFFLQGGLWHYQRALGFDLSSVIDNWRQGRAEMSDNPTLAYQNPFHSEPQPLLDVRYGLPQAELPPLLAQEQAFEDYLYHPSQGIEQPSLATANGVRSTLYQTTYHSHKQMFYRAPTPLAAGYGRRTLGRLYEPAKVAKDNLDYPSSMPKVMYEPSQNAGHGSGGHSVKSRSGNADGNGSGTGDSAPTH
ncbi:chlorophyll a/b binding light-harvesting protein [Nodosilinea sp. LEGE 07088]|uniref:chlorophyll a/b binding light-harvesting protein n=1 Tax=Nodosilinea sp. LEGE 07088 TaxID=2777968 RepID=UPI00187FBC47|nr:chlorophyll a/b binding light-harvesting protein [Nodosilinea sp. LEGE 07088]MBE9138407.1 chlorophyll a/b binding light-harvesting protein [Nodosilinea sp. LEGE 07088]